ncbi:PREDICTED: uncharacterized protein LOC106804899 [Priapulus caudatus]|uniref:Uncharacterized protein LOC106804899 n=1 Tax=Priapulus caudatus TaxID=37621 RepID=A0ABM1DPA4_PRICU|nr:PREDICTED: uncharacterized protein LOC106804899 [Priapulus caudatus]
MGGGGAELMPLLGLTDRAFGVSCSLKDGTLRRQKRPAGQEIYTGYGESDMDAVELRVVAGTDPQGTESQMIPVGSKATLAIVYPHAQPDRRDCMCSVAPRGAKAERSVTLSFCQVNRGPRGYERAVSLRVLRADGKRYVYASFKMFKFPDRNTLYFQCDVKFNFCGPRRTFCHRQKHDCEASTLSKRKRRSNEQDEIDRLMENADPPLPAASSYVMGDHGESEDEDGKNSTTVQLYRDVIIVMPGEPAYEAMKLASSREDSVCLHEERMWWATGFTCLAVICLFFSGIVCFQLKNIQRTSTKKQKAYAATESSATSAQRHKNRKRNDDKHDNSSNEKANDQVSNVTTESDVSKKKETNLSENLLTASELMQMNIL